MMPVRIAPARTPRIGFWKRTNNCWKDGTSRRPLTAPVMVSMPNISVAKPSRIMPVSFLRLLFVNMYRMTPITASTGVKEDGLSS